jgi:hypothetical protein
MITGLTPSPKAQEATKQNSTTVGGSQPRCGMAGYTFDALLVGLSISDTPLTYDPPVGRSIQFTITYNQKEFLQPAVWKFSNLGTNWNLSAISYQPVEQLCFASKKRPISSGI